MRRTLLAESALLCGAGNRLRIFAVVQTVASFVLPAGASALLKTLLTLETTRTGFDMRHVLVLKGFLYI